MHIAERTTCRDNYKISSERDSNAAKPNSIIAKILSETVADIVGKQPFLWITKSETVFQQTHFHLWETVRTRHGLLQWNQLYYRKQKPYWNSQYRNNFYPISIHQRIQHKANHKILWGCS